jgi:MYXO-CTERM domain-containing protein
MNTNKAIGAVLAVATMFTGLLPHAAAADPRPATERVATCSWNQPGHNPFMGDVVAAVDRYQDIPLEVRQRLKQRMAARQYDDMVSIKRDSIEGKGSYEPRIRDMHFGSNRVCGDVSRTAWTAQMQERGLVYCESGQCVLVPTVCRNVSRIARAPGALAPAVAAAPPAGELAFEPPGAGVPPAAGAAPGGAPAGDGVAMPLGSAGAGSFADLAGPAGTNGGLYAFSPWATPAGGVAGGFASAVPDSGGGGAGGLVGRDDDASRPPTLIVPPGASPLSPGNNLPPLLPPVGIPTAVPEPGTWLTMLLGLAALGALRYRRAPKCATQKRS